MRYLNSKEKAPQIWRSFRLFLAATCVLVISSCSKNDKLTTLPQSFVYEGDFLPSFLPASSFIIQAHQGIGQLKFTRYQMRDTLQHVMSSDSVVLSEGDLRTFFAALDSVPLLKMVTREQLGTDGIDVVNKVLQNGSHNQFRFWSPKKHTQEHKLVEAVLGLARRKFPALPQHEYFESLEEYFDFGLPCEITSTSPYEVRIHGVIYHDETWAKNLQAFLQQLPDDQPILINMTNFRGMAWDCHPIFRRFLVRNPKVIWVPSENALEDLDKIGVRATHRAKSVEEGRQLVKQL